jgi:hypothetical protein
MYAASVRDMNSVKSCTRFVFGAPCMRRSVPGILTSSGSPFPTKQGSVVIPSPCGTATICAPESVVVNGPSVVQSAPLTGIEGSVSAKPSSKPMRSPSQAARARNSRLMACKNQTCRRAQ